MKENFEFKENIFNYLIEQVKPIFEKEEELELLNKSYNIFEILHLERKEVELHSNFIYDLLNPEAIHGKSSIFLKVFLKEVLGYNGEQLENFNPNDYDICREVTTEEGRIDFIIDDLKNKRTNIIEMKIDAEDQEKQLIRYDKYAKKLKKDYKIYYLTLDGRDASKQSAGNIEYTRISFKVNITNWLKEILKRLDNLSNFKIFIEQYLKTVKNITDSIESDDIKREYLRCLGDDKNIIKYLEALVKENETIKRKILDNLNKEIYDELTKEFSIKMELAERYEGDDDYISIYVKKIGNLKNIRFGAAVGKGELYFYIGVCKGIENDIIFEEEIINKKPYIDCFDKMKDLRKNLDYPYYYEYFYKFEKDENFILVNEVEYNRLKENILIFMKAKVNELINCSKGDE